ncbi:hypothetical protein G3569_10670 [Aliifodinibius halophilus]|uniref:C-type lysozyme inhibitor domain-containing protein n=1 Tax=Fodinibius halophilus TaxID=1736908 RepID=A0A6M1T9W2_9BACT|nr:MliC family protein [Fodinibius halophilus]NGP88821.1 hypothetical protein [Fodinibius halophilus]
MAVGLCAGCNTEKKSTSAKPDQDSLEIALPDFSSIQTSDVFVYNCGDSLQFSAHVTPDSSWLFLPDTTVKVKSVRSGSGARYEGNAYLYWSKGNEAILQKPRGSFMTCQAVKKEKAKVAARIRGVGFLALGQEPGWRIEITNGEQIKYVGNYGQDTVYVPVPQPVVDKEKNRKTYTTQTEAHSLTIEITDKPCTDSMNGIEYPSTVQLTIDGKTHQGCGEAL